MNHRYTLQIVVGLRNPKTKALSVSKNTKFSQDEMRKHAEQYAIDHQLNPDTVGVNQLEDGKEMKGDQNHYESSAKVNAKKTGDKKEIEIEIGKGAKVGTLNVKESFLASLEESINLNKLNGASASDVRNAFAANYVTALLLLKLQDLLGLMLINDHAHAKLTKFSNSMSDLNFWGRALFYSSDSDVRNRMNGEDAKILAKMASKVSSSRIQKMMKVPMTAPDALDWNEAIGSILLLQHTFDLKSSYFNGIIRTLYKWDAANVGAKQKAINDALMFMMQSDPQSKVIPHLRKLSNLVMTKQIGSVAQKIIGFTKLNETDGGDASGTGGIGGGGGLGGGGNAILNPSGPNINSQTGHPDTSQDMQNTLGGLYKLRKLAPNQITKKGRFTIRNGKLIKKRVKDFSPKKFKAPDFLKPQKQEVNNEEDSTNV